MDFSSGRNPGASPSSGPRNWAINFPRVLSVDSKDLRMYRQAGVTAVKPNYAQATALAPTLQATGCADRSEAVIACGEDLLAATGSQIAAVTLDGDGAVIFERDRPPYRTFARPSRAARVAGAGDTYLCAFTLALAAGATTPVAAELASAAAVVVGKEGTATCTAGELREQFLAGDKYFESADRLAARLEFHRQQGRRIVFTNGCFDILHRGHITYLNQAKAMGDLLVVGLNSDASVRRLKGPERPINPLDDRAQVLASLSCVDHVVAFDEDTPSDVIARLRPDIFVKGGDYTREMLPEAAAVEAAGGVVRILPYVEDRSTTGIIDRIRRPERGR